MSQDMKIVTGLGKAELHRIVVQGYDLTEELVGKITFSQMTFLMLMGRMPTGGQTRMIDALLTILVDRKSTRLNSSHSRASRMPSSA